MGRTSGTGLRRAWRGRFGAPLCRAPFGSMYFDQFGGVRACCANNGFLLGDATRESIRDIWLGAAAERLRRALRAGDLSQGCDLCAWQVAHGDRATMARSFDRLAPVGRTLPPWPEEMQFALSNACNLQCVMCTGDNSSAIRSHREHLPPLPRVYGDRFFVELAEFVPHLRRTQFLGGEPLMSPEALEVMELIAARNPSVAMHVTTNGTIWSDRHQAIFDAAPLSFSVSIDGLTPETFEAVRVGADFDTVMGNLERFRALAGERGTWVGISHCLMVDNWHEFGDLLEWADERELACYVNAVLFPVDHSLVQLTLDELREVVDGLEAREGSLRLTELRPVWDEQVAVLRQRLAELQAHPDRDLTDPWAGEQAVQRGSSAGLVDPVPVHLDRRVRHRTGAVADDTSAAPSGSGRR